MRLAHSFLMALYLVLPVIAGAISVYVWRCTRSGKPLLSFLITCISGSILSVAICLIYGRLLEGSVSIGQMLVLAYFAVGVLALLKGFSWLLRETLERLFVVHFSQNHGQTHRVGWVFRAAGAMLVRTILLFGVGLPYIIAIGFVYRPKVVSSDDPKKQMNVSFENVRFQSADGTRLAGWWIPATPPMPGVAADENWGKRTVIVCHGLGADKSNQLALARELPTNGYNILAFDFRAHGESGGQITSFGDLERADVLGAVQWVREQHAPQSIRLYGLGISMGGAALIEAAADDSDAGRAFDAIAVYSTFDDFAMLADDVTEHHLLTPLGWLVRNVSLPIMSLHIGSNLRHFAPGDNADKIAPRPLMVIHGRGDMVVPFESGVRLYERASQPKVRCWIGKLEKQEDTKQAPTYIDEDNNKADHVNVMYNNNAAKAVRMFFEKSIPTL